jgi:hypothetical protein
MRNQLRLLPQETSAPTDAGPENPSGSVPVVRPRRRRNEGPSRAAGRIDTRTRRAGREGVAEARRALLAATTEAELPRAG